MAERRRNPSGHASVAKQATASPMQPSPATSPVRSEDGDEAERVLGRAVGIGLPVLSILAAITVGFVASVGSGLLVLASGALLGTIALLWASVRTLSGDAPLPADLEALAAQGRDVDALGEQKRRVLRALKDLESEHAIGKIDDTDYEVIAMQYRDEAKALMRKMDRNAAPALAEAERIAHEYLVAQGLASTEKVVAPSAPQASVRERMACPGCSTSNEPDAAFCKKCGSAMNPGSPKAVEKHDATS